MTERFEADWLALREAADAAARDRMLTERAARWLQKRRRPLRLVDLGAGGGNNAAWLAPRLPGAQQWRLIDHDPELLARAGRRRPTVLDGDGSAAQLETRCRDLSDLEAAVPNDTDLATASALFDLVSADWIEALAERCTAVGCGALWALSVDGRWHFEAVDADHTEDRNDASMREILVAHQRRDKGLGSALGGDAPRQLAMAFRNRGYAVYRAPSAWRLEPGDPLAPALLNGWHTALLEQAPERRTAIDAWWRSRREALGRAELRTVVGHVDIWAEPPS
jgi:hypothetical protein